MDNIKRLIIWYTFFCSQSDLYFSSDGVPVNSTNLMVTFKILNEEASCTDKWGKISNRTQRYQIFGGYCEKQNSCNQASKASYICIHSIKFPKDWLIF
jgi:hypothetical protein